MYLIQLLSISSVIIFNTVKSIGVREWPWGWGKGSSEMALPWENLYHGDNPLISLSQLEGHIWG